MTIYRGAFGVLSTVVPPSGKIGTKQQQPQQHSLCVYMPVATAVKYSRLIQICASIWTATLAVINVRHAAALSRAGPTCSDTRVAAGLHPSFVMCVEDRLPGSGISTGTKEPCSAVDHLNRGQRRNEGKSHICTKTLLIARWLRVEIENWN